jgi:outer membrane protein assembly factor BamB
VWDAEKGINIKWKTPISGFAHSSPVVWGDRIFVTTAIPKDSPFFRLGGGDEGGASAYTKDNFPHSWRVYALDKVTGKILWERVSFEGIPKTARHVMASQANSTPVTDGQHLVVFFGSEGLYCYDLDGKLLWKRDLGPMPSGRYLDPSYEWNTAASPIIYKNLLILQLDIVDTPYMTALDIKTGKEVWRTKRDEQPSWPTPLLYDGPPRTELITAAALFARAYDPDTGKELWRLGKHSALATPTPVAGKGLIFITSGGGTTVQPIYAIRPGGHGDITLKDGEDSNDHVVWSKHRGGSYIPSPLVYGDLLYLCSNNGIVTAYNAETGDRVYQQRLSTGGGYSASPVAADGHLYFSSEDGDVVVVKAGPTFERLSVNKMGEVIMATPAISSGMIIVRTQHHVFAIAESK